MYVVVAGCGRVGAELSIALAGQGHDVVVIDKDPGSFRRLGPVFNGITITGIGFDEKVLALAGIENADAFVAVTEYDNTNLMAAEVADKIFKVPRVIARLYNPERETTYKKLGVEFVCGTTLLADQIFENLIHPGIPHYDLDEETKVIEFPIKKGLIGKRLADIALPVNFSIIAVRKNGKSQFYHPDTTLAESDSLIAITKNGALTEASKLWEG